MSRTYRVKEVDGWIVCGRYRPLALCSCGTKRLGAGPNDDDAEIVLMYSDHVTVFEAEEDAKGAAAATLAFAAKNGYNWGTPDDFRVLPLGR